MSPSVQVAASKLRILRDQSRMTQEELARRSGVDARTIRRIERGETQKVARNTETCLATALGVSVDELWGDDGSRGVLGDAVRGHQNAGAYRSNLIASLRPRIEPFVPLRTESGRDLLTDIGDAIRSGRHVCVLGPSGSGKSYSLLRAAVLFADQGHIPVIARCRLLTGAPEIWLDHAVAVYGAASFAALASAANTDGHILVVVADGLNELGAESVDIALEALQGIAMRQNAVVLVTAQERPARWVNSLGLQELQVALPTHEQKLELASALGLGLQMTRADMFRILDTPMDFFLAAEAWAELEDSAATRFALTRAFAMRRLSRTSDVYAHCQALRGVASVLAERVSRTMAEVEFSRSIENSAGPTAIGAILQSGLCVLEDGRVGFYHDLIQDYFAAEALVYSERDIVTLARSLDRPALSGLAALVLQAQGESQEVAALFHASVASQALLVSAVAGSLGRIAQETALGELRRVTSLAVDALRETTFHHGPPFARIQQPREWTRYEKHLFTVLGASFLVPEAKDLLIQLLRAADEWIESVARSDGARDVADDALCSIPANTPVSTALLSAHNCTQGLLSREELAKLESPKELEDTQTATGRFWCTVAHARYRSLGFTGALSDELQSEAVAFVAKVLASGRESLMIAALEMADDLADALGPEARRQMGQVLDATNVRGAFASTFLIDALDAYGLIESAYDECALALQIRELLAKPDDPSSQQKAYSMLSLQLEAPAVVHLPHIAAVSELSSDASATFRAMAALGRLDADGAHAIPLCLRQLRRVEGAGSLPLVRRAVEAWALRRPTLGFMAQEEVRAFVEAQRCIVELALPDPKPGHPRDHTGRVWLHLGDLLRRALSDHRMSDDGEAWTELRTELLGHAVIPIVWLLTPSLPEGEGPQSWVLFQERWRTELLEFVRAALAARIVVQGEEHCPSLMTPRVAVVRLIGELGGRSDVERLRKLVDDSEVGLVAVEAMKQLSSRGDASRIRE